MPRWPDTREPYTRDGLCCGCGRETTLIKVFPGVYRYRCAECARDEMRGIETQWIPGEPRKR